MDCEQPLFKRKEDTWGCLLNCTCILKMNGKPTCIISVIECKKPRQHLVESVNVEPEVGLTKRSNENEQRKLKLQGDIPELEFGVPQILVERTNHQKEGHLHH